MTLRPGDPRTESPTVSAIDLAVGYGERPVWSGASFTVSPGEFVAVLGPNGAGKSTLLRLLLGLIPPSAGALSVLGRPPRRGSDAIGYVPQSRPFDPGAAIRGVDVVTFGLEGTRFGVPLPGRARRQLRERVAEAVAAVGATSYAQRRIGELSGGERQRLYLAQALIGDPALLLLDEPLASLDVRNQALMARLIASLARERNLAVLLVAHDVNPLLPVLDRVLYVAGGQVATGIPDEVITSETLSRLYGAPVEVLIDSRGRRFVVGLEDETTHPHDHNHDHDELGIGMSR